MRIEVAISGLLALVSAGALACGYGIHNDHLTDGGTSSSSHGTASSVESSDTGSSTGSNSETTTSEASSSSTNCEFVCYEDLPDLLECDTWTQDCPEGAKCVLYNHDGSGVFDATMCVPDSGDGLAGDLCTRTPDDPASDTCSKGHLCWYLNVEGQGACIEMCTAPVEDPHCSDPCGTCRISANGVQALCFPGCDPLSSNCWDGFRCVHDPAYDAFSCAIGNWNEPISTGEPCQYSCGADDMCISTADFPHPNCEDSDGCCASYCDLNAGEGAQNPTCMALADVVPGSGCEPALSEPALGCADHVGICRLPD